MTGQMNDSISYRTDGGVLVDRISVPTPYDNAVSGYVDRLDTRRGAVFSSNYEYPGRYTRWDTAIIDPPLGIASNGRTVWLDAYNERGNVLLDAIETVLADHDHIASIARVGRRLDVVVKQPDGVASEELRSRVPTVFSVLRAIVDLFRSDADPSLALYGAFGYDLAFQFDPIDLSLMRPDDQRDMVLYLPDEISSRRPSRSEGVAAALRFHDRRSDNQGPAARWGGHSVRPCRPRARTR